MLIFYPATLTEVLIDSEVFVVVSMEFIHIGIFECLLQIGIVECLPFYYFFTFLSFSYFIVLAKTLSTVLKNPGGNEHPV